MVGYEQAIEIKMQRLFSSLSERDKRRYAGIEAAKWGYGGMEYISKLFDIDPKTIRRGLQELDLTDEMTSGRVRKHCAVVAPTWPPPLSQCEALVDPV